MFHQTYKNEFSRKGINIFDCTGSTRHSRITAMQLESKREKKLLRDKHDVRDMQRRADAQQYTWYAISIVNVLWKSLELSVYLFPPTH